MIAILLGAILMVAPDSRQHDHPEKPDPKAGHGKHGKHGNPHDLADYVARMEEPGRAAWQKPDEVVRALAMKPGQTACDVGAGPGYFSLRLAAAVGAAGRVFAVDVEPAILAALGERLKASGARNVTPVLALPDDPLLPAGACDLVLVVDTWHHFPDGAAYLKALKRTLKPGGRVANIDFNPGAPVGPAPEHLVPKERFLADAARAGFTVAAEHALLPYQYFVVLQAK